MKTVAVIPIKQLNKAKQRLTPDLDERQRKGLFTAMVEDVLTAVTGTGSIDGIMVISDDPEARMLARRYGAETIDEPQTPGMISSVTEAGRLLASRGTDCLLFLPGDIPLVTVQELEIVISGTKEREKPVFTIVPASDLGGSNCVACSPPDCMEFVFGEDSFRRHISVARKRGIESVVLKLPGIGLDIDTPDDLRNLVQALENRNMESHVSKFFHQSGLYNLVGSKSWEGE